ncbi:MAG: helix-turn-helix domain-containing protein [Lachnospiraceae bacterium]|nr:helix-turn-helix domain-containing protein [Lachnospiraceae bacterium]
MENVELLMNFGLTRQEATIYILLLLEGNLNGYEVSKRSGISRSNAYNTLAGLVEKGAAYVIEEQTVRYMPVPIEELCVNKIHRLQEAADQLKNCLPVRREDTEDYITIKGKKQIDDKLRNLILNTKERIYLSLSREKMEGFRTLIQELIDRQIKVVLITDPPFTMEGAVVYHGERKTEQLRVIADSRYVMTGAVTDEYHATCLYSSNNNLVEVFKEALSNEIKLIKIKEG